MFYRDGSRSGLSMLHVIAILAIMAATGFPSKGWAIVAGSPPKDNQTILVAEQLGSTSIEQKAMNHICRAADLPYGSLPAERLPAVSSLSPELAKSIVGGIQEEAKTQTPVCTPQGVSPDGALELLRKVRRGDGVPPIVPPGIHPGIIRPILDQVKANEK